MIRANLRYAIVSLQMSRTEVAEFIMTTAGVSVDPDARDVFAKLDNAQLDSLWRRISEDESMEEAFSESQTLRWCTITSMVRVPIVVDHRARGNL